jgi:hypothetical protein
MSDEATWDDLIAAGVERALAQDIPLDDIEQEFEDCTDRLGAVRAFREGAE